MALITLTHRHSPFLNSVIPGLQMVGPSALSWFSELYVMWCPLGRLHHSMQSPYHFPAQAFFETMGFPFFSLPFTCTASFSSGRRFEVCKGPNHGCRSYAPTSLQGNFTFFCGCILICCCSRSKGSLPGTVKDPSVVGSPGTPLCLLHCGFLQACSLHPLLHYW